MAKREDGESSTARRILEAALDLFSEQGYAGTSIRQLARAVGVRESSIYNHFASKEAVFQAILTEWGPSTVSWRLQSGRYDDLLDDPPAFFDAFIDDLLDQWLDAREQQIVRLITTDPRRDSNAREIVHDYIFRVEANLLTSIFRHFESIGAVRPLDARETARLFAAGLTHIWLEHLLWADVASSRTVIRQSLDRFTESFRALVAVKP